jgi:hypothetical protein
MRDTTTATLSAEHRSLAQLLARTISMIVRGPEVRQRFDANETRLAAIEQRLARVEQRPELRYVGIHTEGHRYASGCLVTRQGGLWLAEESTDRTPGTDASGWRLIVKAGKA